MAGDVLQKLCQSNHQTVVDRYDIHTFDDRLAESENRAF